MASVPGMTSTFDLDEPRGVFATPVVRALDGAIQPVRVSLLYRLNLLLVAITMLILPLIYIALIAGVGYLVYLHAINDTFILGGTGRAAMARLFAYLAPIVVGGVIVVFMIKPLFAREKRIHAPLTVDEREQPVLHAFVRKLADIVGAPRPKRIDVDCQVNASAGFLEGFWGFLRGDLVLTIGLPLVVGLDARQLSGVLAHELGHFAQGGAMRLTYIIRSISGWFARVVYQRDSWDEALDSVMRSDSHGLIQATAGLAKLCVWVTRQVLKLLMIVGHGVSAFMLRQMEFDADRYEARIAGANAFAEVSSKLSLLSVASQAAFNDLSTAWREQRLCDDLPALVRWRESDMPGEIRRKIADHRGQTKTGWFDTHPCDADRIASARKETGDGLFQFDGPANVLFRDFDDLSRRATVAFYHQVLGGIVQPEHLIATESLVATRSQSQQHHTALRRYFQDLIHPIRPVFLEGVVDRIGDKSAAAEILIDLRNQFLATVADARVASEVWAQADQRLIAAAQVKALRDAGVKKISAADFKLSSVEDGALRTMLASEKQRRSEAAATINHALTLGMQRLELALRLDDQGPPVLKSDTDDRGEYALSDADDQNPSNRLEGALRSISAALPAMETLRHQYYALATLLGACRPQGNSEQLINAVLAASRKTLSAVSQLGDSLGRTPYPYDHLNRSATMYSFVVKELPAAEAVTAVYQLAENALDALYTLYLRILSDLTARAEDVERSLGMPPLSEPEDATVG